VRTYPTDHLRNVVLVGHQGAGKTTLAEAMLFSAGATTRKGSVEDGTTVCDFDPDEIERRASVSLALAAFEQNGYKVNLLDAPGYADFFGDMEAAMHGADCAIIVVSAVDGVQVQTRAAWDVAERLQLPRVFVVTKCDKERADATRVIAQLKDVFGRKIVAAQLPVGTEASFNGIIDLLDEVEHTYADGKRDDHPLPEDHHSTQESTLHEELLDTIVGVDDALMERYLSGETIDRKEVVAAAHKAVAAGEAVPVLCCSSATGVGVDLVLEFIDEECPAPADLPGRPAIRGGEEVAVDCREDAPVLAQVFKTLNDPFVGRLSFIRVYQGVLRADDVLANHTRGHDERLHNLLTLRGKEQLEMTEAHAGDIIVCAKLNETFTGDTLGSKHDATRMGEITFPEPVYHLAIRPKSRGDEDKLSTALHRIEAEDPSFRWERRDETHETVISGLGETHLQVIVHKLERNHVAVESALPTIAYRETIRGPGAADGQLKKQTGGHGQFARCSLEVAPTARGEGYVFEDAVVGGAIPRNFIPAVDKGIQAELTKGPLAGFPVVDVKARLTDGKYHSVDSSDMAFQLAGGAAFKEACQKAGLILLEPLGRLAVTVPDESIGDIMGDLSSRRGRPESTDSIGAGYSMITASVPMGEMQRYAIDLRSMTAGRGSFSLAFDHYEEAPGNVQQQVVKDRADAKGH
jgi:elongation factor G